MSSSFATNLESRRTLKRSTRCGFKPRVVQLDRTCHSHRRLPSPSDYSWIRRIAPIDVSAMHDER
jgi:hypothetical protein